MNQPELTQFFIPSYFRFMIDNWSELKKFIIEHGSTIKEKTQSIEGKQENSKLSSILTEAHINNTVNGPYQHFINLCLKHYSQITKVKLELNLKESDFFKRETYSVNPLKLPDSLLDKTSVAECDNVLSKMNQLTKEMIEQWRAITKESGDQTLAKLSDNLNIKFNQIEEKEFHDDEPLCDLIDRHTELNINFPKLKKGDLDITRYLKLKSTILLHSALNRSQMSNSPSDINKLLNSLSGWFKNISKQCKTLIKEQNKEFDILLKPFVPKKKNN